MLYNLEMVMKFSVPQSFNPLHWNPFLDWQVIPAYTGLVFQETENLGYKLGNIW